MTRSFDVTPKTTEQHLTARSDKSVAYVTNNKRLCSTFCTILKLTTDRHEASRGVFATAELLVFLDDNSDHFYRAMLCTTQTMLWQNVRLSVCPSVTRRYSREMA